MRLFPLPFISHLKILHTEAHCIQKKTDGNHFPEKDPESPKWDKNSVKNACLLCSRNVLTIFA